MNNALTRVAANAVRTWRPSVPPACVIASARISIASYASGASESGVSPSNFARNVATKRCTSGAVLSEE